MNKVYRFYCKVEEILVGTSLITIVVLTFLNAVLRAFNKPITYTEDVCLLLFSWTAFLGADVAMRHLRLVGMDILTKKLSPKAQKVVAMVVYIIMISMLFVLIKGGLRIMAVNGNRPFNTLARFGVGYGAVTAAMPVSGALMIMTCLIKIGKLIVHFKDDSFTLKLDMAKENVGLGEEAAGLDQIPVDFDDTGEVQQV